MNVAFVLLTYGVNELSGIERSIDALAYGYRAVGHRALILTAASARGHQESPARPHRTGWPFHLSPLWSGPPPGGGERLPQRPRAAHHSVKRVVHLASEASARHFLSLTS